MIQYMGRRDVAARIGVKLDSLNRYNLPLHDAVIGNRKGWLPSTIDEWNAARPGRGRWKGNR